jgi:hypothetical protein
MIAEIEAGRDAIVNEVTPQHPHADKIKALAEGHFGGVDDLIWEADKYPSSR